MIPTIIARGVHETRELLTGIRDRIRDAEPAWEKGADDLFDFQRRWWLLTYGSEADKDQRAGRNPAYMEETGGLRASATRRGAGGQVVEAGPDYLFVGITSGLATIHENRGRDVMGEPGDRDIAQILDRVGTYIFTGRL